MTSTGFNIGLGDSSRSSSRVLKPPGGGHTDIFGGEDPVKVRKYHGRNQSSILEGTNPGNEPETPPEEMKVAASEPAQEAQSNVEQASGEPTAAAVAPPAAAANPAQTRVRVPPGGFSSGLW